MKKLLVFIICLFAFPILSKADCNYNELTSIIGNINTSYEYKIVNNKPQFTITLSNLTNDLMIHDTITGKIYCNTGKCKDRITGSELKINTSYTGNYNFDFYKYECGYGYGTLGTKTVKLPTYNAYYKDELCKGLESYKQCQRWSGYSATRETFEKDIKNIKEEIAKKNAVKEEKKVETKKWHEIFVQVLLDYWWLFVIILSIIIALCYFIIAQRKKKEYNFDV